MKKITSILLVLFISIMLVGCSNKTDEEITKYSIEVSVYDKTNTAIYEEKIETEEKILLDAIKNIKDLKVVTENSEYGAFITSIKGINQEEDYYWNYYINSDYATVGVDSYKIKENDKIEFRLEKFE